MASRIVGTNNTWTNCIMQEQLISLRALSKIAAQSPTAYTPGSDVSVSYFNKEGTVREEFDLLSARAVLGRKPTAKITISTSKVSLSVTRRSPYRPSTAGTVLVQVPNGCQGLCSSLWCQWSLCRSNHSNSVHDIHQDNIFTKTFEGFSKFNTDVTTTNYGDTVCVCCCLSMLDHFFSVLAQFNDWRFSRVALNHGYQEQFQPL